MLSHVQTTSLGFALELNFNVITRTYELGAFTSAVRRSERRARASTDGTEWSTII